MVDSILIATLITPIAIVGVLVAGMRALQENPIGMTQIWMRIFQPRNSLVSFAYLIPKREA